MLPTISKYSGVFLWIVFGFVLIFFLLFCFVSSLWGFFAGLWFFVVFSFVGGFLESFVLLY